MKNSELKKAKEIFASGEYTCVLCKGEAVLASTERGIKPLLQWLDGKTDVKGFSAVDRVVGRAAAFLYVLLEVGEVYAGVMSEGAVDVFSKYGIRSGYGVSAKEIMNREGTGICPMEQAVKGIDIPEQALEAVRNQFVHKSGMAGSVIN